jgi:hypothetical protein
MPKPNVLERNARAINPSAWSHDLDRVARPQPWKMSVIRARKDSAQVALRVLVRSVRLTGIWSAGKSSLLRQFQTTAA